MVDLGKHSVEILASYGASLAMLGGLIWISLRRARKMRAELTRMEAERDG